MAEPNNPRMRIASWLLIYLTAVQPLHPAIAAGIQPDNARTKVQTRGQIPVVDIAAPNAAGVSHNHYRDFNVTSAGAVLNNATTAGNSALARHLAANPHLTGNSAQLIINEVTGGQPSSMGGMLEVFGGKANVIVANPNGLNCNGCRFSNMGAIALTTGTPLLNSRGELDKLNVVGGAISVGNKGFNALDQNDAALISRTLKLDGEIRANQLDIILGPNQVDYQNGHIQPLPAVGAALALAVDSSALGGMYANRIRLVSTEKEVGTKLKNIVSHQGDIRIDTAGYLSVGKLKDADNAISGNITAKKDLNISAPQIYVFPGSKVNSGQDITLVNKALYNAGQVSAGRDMRLFSDHLVNLGQQAELSAHNQMWIQKDAAGNKNTQVENKSGIIKTRRGDLIIRTDKLDNTRLKFNTEWLELAPNSSLINIYAYDKNYKYHKKTAELTQEIYADGFPETWFDIADFRVIHERAHWHLYKVNTERSLYQIAGETPIAKIYTGGNLYINASQFNNKISGIGAEKDIFLTGNDFLNSSSSNWIKDDFVDYEVQGGMRPRNHAMQTDWYTYWTEAENHLGIIVAGGNVVLDFNNSIHLQTLLPETPRKWGDSVLLKEKTLPAVLGNNIVLHAKTITNNDLIQASGDITLIADDTIYLNNSALRGRDISLTALNDINSLLGEITGQDIMLLSRQGDIQFWQDDSHNYYLQPDRDKIINQIDADGDFSAIAGKNINLTDTLLHPANNITMSANKDINIINSEKLLYAVNSARFLTREENIQYLNKLFYLPGKIKSHQDITFNAGNNLTLRGIALDARQDINLHAAHDIDLTSRDILSKPDGPLKEDFFHPEDDYYVFFPASRTPELSTQINAKGNLLINSGRDILAGATNMAAGDNIALLAGRNTQLAARLYTDEGPRQDQHVVTRLQAGKALNVVASDQLLTYGAELSSGGNMTLTSGGNMRFESLLNEQHQGGGENFSYNKLQQPTQLKSGGILTLISNGSILFQATQLVAKKVMDVAAEGGYLFAQAMEETSHAEQRWDTRKWWGRKKHHHNVQHTATNKVTEFTAEGDINLLSRDDSTYQASKIAAGQNAKLTSTHGKVIFAAVKNSSFAQKTTLAKGFYIKHSDKGYLKEKWALPTIQTGGELTVAAAQGISANIKVKNSESLRNAITVLGNTPGNEWLNDLNLRDDVQWQKVMDAYSRWDHSDEQLNPVVAVVIAIAVATATAGSGLVATTNAAAGGGVAGGAVSAGMSTLASQAAVSLMNNQGDISKTFKELGSKESVKSLVTSMAVGGALSGFDAAMGWDKAADGASAAKLPRLSNGDWSKVAQRVAGQSMISSSLNTGINGGSFKENLTTALFANIGGQLHAEGAHLIGNNGSVLGVQGKALSHALVAGVAAEIGGGNAKGAAAGALAAELAGVVMGDNFIGPQQWQEKSERQAQFVRFLGGVTGAVFTGKAEGAYSGANAAEMAFRYNYLSHHQQKLMDAEMNAAETLVDKGNVFIRWGLTSTTQEGAFAAGIVAGVPEGLYDSAVELLGVLKEPKQIFMALKELVNSDDVLGQVGQSIKRDWLSRIDRMEEHYQKAGNLSAYNSGVEGGKLLFEFGGYAAGAGGVMKGGARLASKQIEKFRVPSVATVNQSATGIKWGQGINQQGMPWENYVGTQLPQNSRLPVNFKTFDYYNRISRTAISVKTLDTTTAARVANPRQIYSSLKGNIDVVASFKTYELSGRRLNSAMITSREVQLALPINTTKTQWAEINRVIEYGKSQGVNVIVTQVK
ncbi:filamentous hemagglutinin outer membrane protein [Yersinia pekkanenii]|uniref:Filamentous hemagglutinin outer membrane protein n=1 Tax=Yersinia pekkanenii TaxID=1288385 RepID=A0A0T9PXJ3_9GAMM|nr:DUF637 domain-containing protein [Yersinia pekkanenii]CNH85106.1 filamentous hemagglutinin outer membrane protein [Yersinia pekkanenii]